MLSYIRPSQRISFEFGNDIGNGTKAQMKSGNSRGKNHDTVQDHTGGDSILGTAKVKTNNQLTWHSEIVFTFAV
jgi:hypothetical protein